MCGTSASPRSSSEVSTRKIFPFLDLPPELQEEILTRTPVSTFLSLRLVCKVLKKLVDPHLYPAWPTFTLINTRPDDSSMDVDDIDYTEELQIFLDEQKSDYIPPQVTSLRIRITDEAPHEPEFYELLFDCIKEFSHHTFVKCSFDISLAYCTEETLDWLTPIIESFDNGLQSLLQLETNLFFDVEFDDATHITAELLQIFNNQLEEFVYHPLNKFDDIILRQLVKVEGLKSLRVDLNDMDLDFLDEETFTGAVLNYKWPTRLEDLTISRCSNPNVGLTTPCLVSLLLASSHTLTTLDFHGTLISTYRTDKTAENWIGQPYPMPPSPGQLPQLSRITFSNMWLPPRSTAAATAPYLIEFITHFFSLAPISTIEFIATKDEWRDLWLPVPVPGADESMEEEGDPRNAMRSAFSAILEHRRGYIGWVMLRKIVISRRIYDGLGAHKAILRELEGLGVAIELMDGMWVDRWAF